MKIQKTSETRPLTGTIVNQSSNSQVNTYSCDYINTALATKQNTLSTQQVSITTAYNHVKVYRYGNVISFDIDGNIQETSGTIATGLPGAINLVYVSGLNTADQFSVDTAGNLKIAGHTAGVWSNCHGVYICKNN